MQTTKETQQLIYLCTHTKTHIKKKEGTDESWGPWEMLRKGFSERIVGGKGDSK